MELEPPDAPMLSLSRYSAMVSKTPLPSDDQIAEFARFVSTAHSWYKHLPLFPPGIPFHFYVNPFSGHDRVVSSDGRVSHRLRADSSDGFHYTWMTTAEYRRRFAALDYVAAAGTSLAVRVRGGVLVQRYDIPVVFSAQGQPFQVPREVLDAGRVEVTGAIHPMATTMWFSKWIAGFMEAEGVVRQWPAETGGEETLTRIAARAEAIRWPAVDVKDIPRHPGLPAGTDLELETLMAPERRRLQNNMVVAMKAVRTLIYG